MESTTPPKTGKIRRGWQLTKSAWLVLRLDKELTAIPLISMFFSLLALLPFILIAVLNMSFVNGGIENDLQLNLNLGNWNGPFWIAIYLVSAIVANFFAVAISCAVLERFNGGDPTIKGSIQAARKRIRSIIAFSIVATTVGLVLRAIEERVPLGGRIAVWLVNAAWSIATLFAIPVIAASDEYIQPLAAVKKSGGIIRKVWGESIVAQIGLGLIALLFVVPALIASGLAIALAISTGSAIIGISVATLVIIGLFAAALVFNVLGSIVKTAVYHYAVTGEAPAQFNRELLKASISPKKARKIFA